MNASPGKMKRVPFQTSGVGAAAVNRSTPASDSAATFLRLDLRRTFVGRPWTRPHPAHTTNNGASKCWLFGLGPSSVKLSDLHRAHSKWRTPAFMLARFTQNAHFGNAMPTLDVSTMNDGRNVKCPRCWHWHGSVENFGHLPEEITADPKLAKEKLCDSCQQTILRNFPDHPSVPHIHAALEAQRIKYQNTPRL